MSISSLNPLPSLRELNLFFGRGVISLGLLFSLPARQGWCYHLPLPAQGLEIPGHRGEEFPEGEDI